MDGAKWLRIFWALVTAVLTVAMLVAGGVTTMEHATLIFALPVTIIAYLVMASFSKVLRMERAEREGTGPASEDRGGARRRGAGEDWRQRLAHLRAYPSNKAVAQFVDTVIHPALVEVKDEFRQLGLQADLTTKPNAETGIDENTLLVHIPTTATSTTGGGGRGAGAGFSVRAPWPARSTCTPGWRCSRRPAPRATA